MVQEAQLWRLVALAEIALGLRRLGRGETRGWREVVKQGDAEYNFGDAISGKSLQFAGCCPGRVRCNSNCNINVNNGCINICYIH